MLTFHFKLECSALIQGPIFYFVKELKRTSNLYTLFTLVKTRHSTTVTRSLTYIYITRL